MLQLYVKIHLIASLTCDHRDVMHSVFHMYVNAQNVN